MSWKENLPWNWSKKGAQSPEILERNPFALLQRQMNSLFDDFMGAVGLESVGRGFIPRITVSEDKEKMIVSAELPGMEQNDIEVTLTKEALTIRGEKKDERKEEEGTNRYVYERSFGYFQRTIPLTAEVDENKVDASFKNGVLTITLTKTAAAQAQSKKIPIR